MQATPTDNELIQSFLGGDDAAFMTIVSRYKDPITNYIRLMIGDYDRAVELAQETFLRVYRNAERYRNTYQFSTWIYKIATNLAIDEMRWRRRYSRIFSPGPSEDTEGEGRREWLVADRGLRPDQVLLLEEKRRAVLAAIQGLPKKYRTALVLREIQGLPYERIAEVLGCSTGTVKSRLHRAKEILRRKLAKYF